MPEYQNVEKPFLQKLRDIGWTVLDQGTGIPKRPEESKRGSFNEVALQEEFCESAAKLNPWATREQLLYCYDRILTHSESLIEVNHAVYEMLRKGITLPGKNILTGEENLAIRLVDLEHWEQNSFIAINQFRISTPTTGKECIIPDIVCFVNGLPWIVIECKDLYISDPLSEAYIQIRRYSNQRGEGDPYSMPEGKEQLFYPNLFLVVTHGTEAKFGTICADFDYFNNWREIFPEKYITPDTAENSTKQEVLIGGMFNREILIDIFRNFTIFTTSGSKLIKIICRYQQYRAVGKIIDRLSRGADYQARSGVIWHTQGSGKSLTMVFLIRKMRTVLNLKQYKILMVVDRLDLESQLGETAALTGETPSTLDSRSALSYLENDTPNLNLVMIHKFGENSRFSMETSLSLGFIPKFEVFPTLNESEKILILIDEAHRSQGGDMAANLCIAFPHATRIGFTGTPLLTQRHKIKTAERFYQKPNDFIDTYKMNDSVRDHSTVDVKYIGKATADEIQDKEAFDKEYELLFINRSKEERQTIMKRYGTMRDYLASVDRVKKIARDIMTHYVQDILPNGFKAIVVSASILAAARYKYELEKLIPEYIADEEAKTEEERDEDLLARLKILKVRAVISPDGNNEVASITAARKQGEGKAVLDAFKANFNTEDPQKSDSGIALLCVCDRLLTGFDAPIAQVMYLDRSLKEHTLLQAIARVNRTKKGKTHGLVVDYFGNTRNLRKALGIYTDPQGNPEDEIDSEELREFEEYFKDINKEIPELALRYQKIIQFFQKQHLPLIESFLLQTMPDEDEENFVEEIIELMASLKLRAEFHVLFQNYCGRLDILFNLPEIQKEHWIRAKRLGYLVWRIAFHYRDNSMDIKDASEKVRKLIDKYLRSIGITEKISDAFMLTDDFPTIRELYKNHKSQASAMEHAIRRQIKVYLQEKDPGSYEHFKDRLDNIISSYQGNWTDMVRELEKLKNDIANGNLIDDPRFTNLQMPFYTWLKRCAVNNTDIKNIPPEQDEKIERETKKICGIIKDHIEITNFWEKEQEVKELRDNIAQSLRFSLFKKIIQTKDELFNLADQLLSICKSNYAELMRRLHDLA